jgi:beta-xylosidase
MKYRDRTIYYDRKGYPIISVDGKDVKLHVYVWEEANGEKPEGYQLHHKDFDKKNYSLDNLELVTQSDHLRIHAGWERENGEWVRKPCNGCNTILQLDEFHPRKGKTPSALCKKCHNAKVAERRNDPKWRKKNREYQKLWAREWRKKQ